MSEASGSGKKSLEERKAEFKARAHALHLAKVSFININKIQKFI